MSDGSFQLQPNFHAVNRDTPILKFEKTYYIRSCIEHQFEASEPESGMVYAGGSGSFHCHLWWIVRLDLVGWCLEAHEPEPAPKNPSKEVRIRDG